MAATAGRGLTRIVIPGLLLFALYLLTRSHVHGWDAAAYAARAHDHPVLSERYLSTRLLHPHHLLYVPLARVFAALLPGRDPFLPLQVLSALGAAVAAMAAGALVGARGGTPSHARMATLATGLAYGTWRYGAEAEVMAPALALLLLGLLALARAHAVGARAPTRAHAWAGLAFAAATLIHQTTAVFAGAVLAVLGVAALRRRMPRPAFAAFALAWMVPVTAVYVAAALREAGPAGMLAWATGAAGRAGGFSSLAGLPSLASLGTIGALVPLQPFSDLRWFGPGTSLVAGALVAWVVLVTAAITFAIAWPALVRALREGDPLTRVMVAGVIALTVAIGFFQPWNEEYWVYVPPLLVLLAAIHVPFTAPVPRVAYATLAGLLGLGLAYAWWPRHAPEQAPYAEALAFARTQLAPGDLVTGGDEELGSALVVLPLLAAVDALPTAAPGDDTGRRRLEHAVRARLAGDTTTVAALPRAWPELTRIAGTDWRLEPFGELAGRPIARLVRR